MHAAPAPQNEKTSNEPTRRKKPSRFASSQLNKTSASVIPPALSNVRARLPERRPLPSTSHAIPADGPPLKRTRPSRFSQAANTHAPPIDNASSASFDLAAIPIRLPPKTVRINQEAEKKQKLETVLRVSDKDYLDTNPKTNPYFDPALRKPRAPRPIPRGFKFVDKGSIVAQAEESRQQALVQARRDEYTAQLISNSKTSDLPILPPLEEDLTVPTSTQVPSIEWWDLPLRRQNNQTQTHQNRTTSCKPNVNSSGETIDDLEIKPEIQIRDERITHYIHHPVPIEPVKPKKEAPVIPLMLTKKETKKLRRQRRMEAQKEQQDMVAAGLLPPAPPKVKLSNMMRVLATETSVDPTKMEAEVRAQVEARRMKHEAENEARKKSGEEKREKARQKREKDRASGLHAAVFRVTDLSFIPHRFKIECNAKQLELTGVMVLFNGCNVVVVEGGEKSLRKYKALMLRRIDWSRSNKIRQKEHKSEANKLRAEKSVKAELKSTDEPLPKTSRNAEADEGNEVSPSNRCLIAWEGVISSNSFPSFSVMRIRDEAACRKMFNNHHVEHYWDLCLQASPMGGEVQYH